MPLRPVQTAGQTTATMPSATKRFIPLLLAGGAAAFVLRLLLRWLRRRGLERRRASLPDAPLATQKVAPPEPGPTPSTPKGPLKVQHTMVWCMPDLAEVSGARLAINAVVAKLNELPGSQVCFHRYGSGALDRQALLAALGQPDGDRSLGLTHVLVNVADDIAALKVYLHSQARLELIETLRPFIKWGIGVDIDLAVDVHPARLPERADPLLQIVLLRFQAHVARGSEVYASLRSASDALGALCPEAGASAALRMVGHGDIGKEELLKLVEWPDKALGITHCFTIAADGPESLRAFVESDAYVAWLQAMQPQLAQDGHPAAICVYTPQLLDVVH